MRVLPCDLYRLYDGNNRLLYIGVSTRVVERLRQHACAGKSGKTWWPQVAYCTLETFPATHLALAAERAAIRAERPAHNRRSSLLPARSGLGWPDTARGVVA